MNVVLTGFMATGKTTVGKALAQKLNMDFADTDEIIEREYGKISDIFEKYGEPEFRRMETETAVKAAHFDNTVIATGGGIVLNTKNIEILSENGIVVNLEPDRAVIAERLGRGDNSRPLSAGGFDKLWARFEERQKYYDLCDFKVAVTSGRSVEEITAEIAERLHEFSR